MVEETQNTEIKSTDTDVGNQPETQKVSTDKESNVEPGKSEGKPEKMLSQSEVDKIAYGNKMEGYERGKREAIAEANQPKDISATVDSNDDKITVSKQELEQFVEDTATRKAQREHAQRVVDQFVGKMQLGMQKYSDFEAVAGKLNIPNLPPQLIDLVTSMDNTADIIYELGKNPSKFSSVLNLCGTSIQLAHDELTRLSDSIKKNQDAVKQTQVKPNEPLDQAKPSTAGTDDGKLSTVSELRKQPWLRG